MYYYEQLPSIDKILEVCIYFVVAFFIIKTAWDFIADMVKGE